MIFKNTRGEWYVVVQFLLIALTLFGPRFLSWNSSYTFNFSFLFLVLGIFFFTSSVFALRKHLTPLPMPQENSLFVRTGPYRFIRHPMYAGVIFIGFAWAFFAHNGATLGYAFILLIFFDLKIKREEIWLRNKFSQYSDYQVRVKKLIPFLYWVISSCFYVQSPLKEIIVLADK